MARNATVIPFQHYASETPAAVPLPADLAVRELAFNIADGIGYTKNAANVIVELFAPTVINNTLTSTSTTEAASADTARQLKALIDGLGDIHSAADIAGRDTLATNGTADTNDVVHVVDDGDGNWARYQNLGTAAAPAWVKIQDQDALNAGLGATNLGYTASATNGVVTNTSGSDSTIPAATGTNAGLMLPAEKTQLAAQVNAALAYTAAPTNGVVTNTAGTNATIPAADATNAGLLLPAEKTAIANSVNAALAYTASPTNGIVTNTAGTDATLPLATQTNAGLMSPADKTKLDDLSLDAGTF